MGIFANCQILASTLPQSKKSSIWQLLCLELVNISLYTKFYQNNPYSGRPTAISIFSLFFFFFFFFFFLCFCVALVKEKWHLASTLARNCQYLCVPKIISTFTTVLSVMAIFAKWPRTDGQICIYC